MPQIDRQVEPLCRFGPGGDFEVVWQPEPREIFEMSNRFLRLLIAAFEVLVVTLGFRRTAAHISWTSTACGSEVIDFDREKARNAAETANSEIQLTPRQLQLLTMVARFQENRCYSPTLAEMASELSISRSTVYEHIGELRRKGLLSDSANKARSLKVSSKARRLLSNLTERLDQVEAPQPAAIPLAGTVAAGVPIEAIENTESLSLNSCFGSGDDIFALEVRGDSMVGENINEGDYVICRRKNTAHDGELVVAIVDEENATLKRFYKERNQARLQPANDDYEPIYSYNCRIEAVVIGLVRKL